jgi:N-acylneuraminate cytidylyltransferase
MIRRLAVIPARGGSKRIPRKNILGFCGKPMIGHILAAAKLSNLFDDIHVSTEDPEIREVVSKLGFEPSFARPANLAEDSTPIMPVLKHATETFLSYDTKFDEVWLLMACAPLIEASDLIEAAELSALHKSSQAILAVTEYAVPIEWAFNRLENGRLEPTAEGMFATSTAELTPKYYDTGTFAIFSSERVLNSAGAGSDQGFHGFILPRQKGIDIDTMEDWQIAESIFMSK